MRVAVAVAAVLLAACGTGEDTSAEAACRHFHNVAVDASDGVLTDDELRGKIREVADRAEGSTVESESRAMLSAITSGGDFNGAVRNMSDACDRYR